MLSPKISSSKATLLLSAATFFASAAAIPAIAQTPAPPRPAGPPPLVRADPNSPANAGRRALSESLNETAAKYTAARAAAVAAIKTRAEAQARQAKESEPSCSRSSVPLPERTPLNAQVLGTHAGRRLPHREDPLRLATRLPCDCALLCS